MFMIGVCEVNREWEFVEHTVFFGARSSVGQWLVGDFLFSPPPPQCPSCSLTLPLSPVFLGA